MRLVPVFDLDGTLLDSDAALVAPFVALGVDPAAVTFGHVLADECARLGIAVDDYLAAYDVDAAMPYSGVAELLGQLDRWAVCSNKRGPSGRAELARLGWTPAVALFAEDFAGPKRLGPVLDALSLAADAVAFVGDTAHDRLCAEAVGARFLLAGWNPRAAAAAQPDDVVLVTPLDVLAQLD
jgi:phosphoglycolate phosphatase-like HAD superfamily hydrolase